MIRRSAILQRSAGELESRYREIECEVTEKDISDGKTFLPWACPIARSLSRTFGRDVRVDQIQIVCVGGALPIQHWILLPPKVRRFIYNFDTRRWPQWFWCRPFRFKVRVPSYLVK